jgi:hypothetical protein
MVPFRLPPRLWVQDEENEDLPDCIVQRLT